MKRNPRIQIQSSHFFACMDRARPWDQNYPQSITRYSSWKVKHGPWAKDKATSHMNGREAPKCLVGPQLLLLRTSSFSHFPILSVTFKPSVWKVGATSTPYSNVNNSFLQNIAGSGLSNARGENCLLWRAKCCLLNTQGRLQYRPCSQKTAPDSCFCDVAFNFCWCANL